jgi:hypothetical protein
MDHASSRIRLCTLAAGLLASLAWPAAFGQSATTPQVTGSVSGASTDGSQIQLGFTCNGLPTCAGTYGAVIQDSACSNVIAHSGDITVTGLDLTRAGALQGSATLADKVGEQNNADGTCTPVPRSPAKVIPATYTGTWDGTVGTLTVQGNDGQGVAFTLRGGFVANVTPAPPPVFPMTVISNITPTTATVTAQFQPRPEDVGKQEGVFVFAHAPASRLAGPKRAQAGGAPVRTLDSGDPCVLASVGSNGQLTGASASSLAPAFTTVLGGQAQSLSLLNNAPTPGVAGATIFAGYGQDASSMLNGGIYQGAVTVPGAVTCGTILNASAVAKSPDTLSGLWSAPPEQGWGIYFSQRRNILFAAWFTYDGSGKPKWYVASSCAMPAGVTGTSGTCNGDLFEVSGPAFFGVPFDPSRKVPVKAGSLQVRFTDADNASMSYTVAGQSRTVGITRQSISSTAPVAVNFTDLWYNPAEDGWGMAVTQQYDKMFLAWFVYDDSGKPMWYVGPSCTVTGNSCSGQLYSTTGPPFGPTFNPASVLPAAVGTVKVDFTGPNDAIVTYTVNGVSGVKTIQRQTF